MGNKPLTEGRCVAETNYRGQCGHGACATIIAAGARHLVCINHLRVFDEWREYRGIALAFERLLTGRKRLHTCDPMVPNSQLGCRACYPHDPIHEEQYSPYYG